MYYKSEAEIIDSLQSSCRITVLSVEQTSSSLHESLSQNFKKLFIIESSQSISEKAYDYLGGETKG